MDANTGEMPPKSTDLSGWRQVVADGRFRQFPMESIVAAIQDLGPNTDKTVRNALARRFSDEVYSRLRNNVGRNHPNAGRDIIDRAHFQLSQALARPKSADGNGMREAFGSRVMFRLKDAIAKEARDRRIPDEAKLKKSKKTRTADKPAPEDGEEAKFIEIGEHPDLADVAEASDGEDAAPSGVPRDLSLLDGVRDLDQQIDVDRFLEENIADDRKRLAFRLFMDDFPYKSKKSKSIAEALGIDEKTARDWIEEVQELLKPKVGDKS